MTNNKFTNLILKAAQKIKSKEETQNKADALDVTQEISLTEKSAAQKNQSQSQPQAEMDIPSDKTSNFSRSASPSTSDLIDKQSGSRAYINLEALSSKGIINPYGDQTNLAEEFRIIKRPILLNAFKQKKEFSQQNKGSRKSNFILVTSSQGSEGKTFTSINLAMSMATEKNMHVLLVDCDMHALALEESKTLVELLGLQTDKGLLDVLMDSSLNVQDVLVKTNIPNLTILPAGRAAVHATELFASGRMAQVIQEIAERYSDRIIILDAPPILATSETSVLALHAGQIVFVVEAGMTPKKAIKEALERIQSCPSINMVLNKAEHSFSENIIGSSNQANKYKYKEGSKYFKYSRPVVTEE